MPQELEEYVERVSGRLRYIIGYTINIPLFLLGFPFLIVCGGKWADNVSGLTRILPRPSNYILAIPIGAVGLFIQLWSAFYLAHVGKGHHFSQPWSKFFPPPKRLVTGGPYHYCRNPMVFGYQMYTFAVALWANSPGALAFTWPSLVLMFMLLIKYSEEPGLIRLFGEEYENYTSEVPRLLPRMGRHKEMI